MISPFFTNVQQQNTFLYLYLVLPATFQAARECSTPRALVHSWVVLTHIARSSFHRRYNLHPLCFISLSQHGIARSNALKKRPICRSATLSHWLGKVFLHICTLDNGMHFIDVVIFDTLLPGQIHFDCMISFWVK